MTVRQIPLFQVFVLGMATLEMGGSWKQAPLLSKLGCLLKCASN